MFGWLWAWFSALFWKKELEIAVVGVQGAGKVSPLSALPSLRTR